MLYAAYGSNLLIARLERRVATARLLGTARVDGWSLRFDKRGQDGSGKCNIVAADSEIHVAVFELRAEQRQRLDEIEGLNMGYRAEVLAVPGFGECFAYLADSASDAPLAPFEWYKALVVAGCEQHAFPKPYIDTIRTTRHAPDPDTLRHAEHMAIVTGAGGAAL